MFRYGCLQISFNYKLQGLEYNIRFSRTNEYCLSSTYHTIDVFMRIWVCSNQLNLDLVNIS